MLALWWLGQCHGERTGIMPITPFLGDQTFDPETTRIMGVAFEMARAAVKRDWGGLYANHSIAKRIIELAKMASAILMYFANRL